MREFSATKEPCKIKSLPQEVDEGPDKEASEKHQGDAGAIPLGQPEQQTFTSKVGAENRQQENADTVQLPPRQKQGLRFGNWRYLKLKKWRDRWPLLVALITVLIIGWQGYIYNEQRKIMQESLHGNGYSGNTHRSNTFLSLFASLHFNRTGEIVKAKVLRICLICSICIAGAVAALPQTPSRSQQRVPTKRTPRQEPAPEASPEPSPDHRWGEPQEVETLKTDTNLVTVPVIATSIDGNYLPDLQQSEFNVSEDGVKQEVSFFATVNAPFHVVLLLDTSASTREKLAVIRRAAVAFVEQLQSGDRVKVISFDDQVRDLNEFTNDRAALRNAINKTEAGQGTKLYDAFELALSSIRRIQGRKAIVLFTDGVDWRSDQASFDSTLKWLDEEGVIVYPIRYETRQETERIAREQAEDTDSATTHNRRYSGACTGNYRSHISER